MFGKRRRQAEKQPETDINRVVTPMLDMTFQLLFYFVINFKPPIAEGQMDLSLPKEEEGKPLSAPEDKLDDDKADEYRITVRAPAGTVVAAEYRIKQFDPEPLPVDTENDPALEKTLDALTAKLKAIPKPAEGSKTKAPILKIEADNKLLYADLMKFMNACRELGFKEVGVMPIPKRPTGGGGAKMDGM